ncbi:barstar family protein [Clostridiaceae bacterium HSG29]|nr:barstar family protein [Clostridiaceae bacterium HSG29]
MKYVILDGTKMINIEKSHKYLKETLLLSDYYGENLDALWDELSTMGEAIYIELINVSELHNNLKTYAKSLIELFNEVSIDNKLIDFNIK